MSSTLKVWKILTDPTRLRILRLMEKEALTVSELQEILSMGQSRISTHLAQLTKAGLLSSKREGKRTYYALSSELHSKPIAQVALQAASELPEAEKDRAGLSLVLHKRKETARLYFNQVAGRFGRNYGPGRSWQAFAQMLLCLLPENLVIADLGAGEGLVSQLLARSAKKSHRRGQFRKKWCNSGANKPGKTGSKIWSFATATLRLRRFVRVPWTSCS